MTFKQISHQYRKQLLKKLTYYPELGQAMGNGEKLPNFVELGHRDNLFL